MPSIELLPWGTLQGTPSLQIQVPNKPPPDFLIQAYLGHRRPGLTAITLVTSGWGTEELDAAIYRFQSDATCSDVAVMAYRHVTDTQWCAASIFNMVDCSSLLQAHVNVPALVTAMLKLPFIPRPTEIILRDPTDSNITPSVLDELISRLDPRNGAYIHLGTDDPLIWRRATQAVAASCFTWGVRKGT